MTILHHLPLCLNDQRSHFKVERNLTHFMFCIGLVYLVELGEFN